MANSLSIAGLAAECGISPRHLMRTFKASEGTTISDYIGLVRIAHAKARLSDSGDMIKLIAHECGFGSVAAFSAAFRKATGGSPREYRMRAASPIGSHTGLGP